MPKFSRLCYIFCQVVEIAHVHKRTHSGTHTCGYSYMPHMFGNSLWNVGITCCCCWLMFFLLLFSILPTKNRFALVRLLFYMMSKMESPRWRKISHIHTTVCFNLTKLFFVVALFCFHSTSPSIHISHSLSLFRYTYNIALNPIILRYLRLFISIFFLVSFVLWSHLSFISRWNQAQNTRAHTVGFSQLIRSTKLIELTCFV